MSHAQAVDNDVRHSGQHLGLSSLALGVHSMLQAGNTDLLYSTRVLLALGAFLTARWLRPFLGMPATQG